MSAVARRARKARARSPRAAGERAPRQFATAAAFRAWLVREHARSHGLVVAFHRVATGRGGLTYPQALDEVLCFGWIDGLRRGLDDGRYSIRFSPRNADSYWSEVNIGHAKRLIAARRMRPAGLEAFRARDEARTARYSYERRTLKLAPEYAKAIAANWAASAWLAAQAPSYRKLTTLWIMSAKKDETRRGRLETLIAWSARATVVPAFRRLLKRPRAGRGGAA